MKSLFTSKMKTITRKQLLYKTGVEYGDYTINHILGCSHGCTYPCYAFMMARRFGRVRDYEDWLQPRLVGNALELLKKEIPKYRNKIKSVHLCFTTDPFMVGFPEIQKMSLDIIRLLDSHGIKCTAFTKGVLPKELADFRKIHQWGISLVSLSEYFRNTYEPFSASYPERIKSMRELHDKGFKTWVSIEPYPTPNIVEQKLIPILDVISFTDRIIFGRMHYNSLVSKYPDMRQFYNEKAAEVIKYCDERGIDCHIKDKTITKQEKETWEN